MNLMEAIIAAKLGGGGGSVTPASIVTATGQMTAQQAADTLDNIGGEPKKLVVNLTESNDVITADKTSAEITAAYNAGKIVMAKLGFNTYVATSDSEFVYVQYDDSEIGVYVKQLTVSADVWSKAEIYTAPAPLFVTVTLNSSYSGTWSGASWAEMTNNHYAIISIPLMNLTIGSALAFDQGANTVVTSVFMYATGNEKLTVGIMFYEDGTALLIAPNYILPSELNTFLYSSNVMLKPTISVITGTTPAIAATDNTIYECGELTSLTVSSIPANGEFSITFTSGTTATVLTVPNTMIMPDGFAVDANTRYEINCKNGYALVASWPVS